MITTVILFIIYLAFISLGLPDSILGVTLPAMSREWGLTFSDGSLVSMVVIGSTVVSSFISGHIIEKLGTGRITFISCLMTAGALLGISFAPSYLWLLLLAIPLGLGGGAVDSALNNYVALHFKAQHMNWIHSFWGVGATLGPVIMSLSLGGAGTWRAGYRTISIIQLALSFILMLSLPLWKRVQTSNPSEHEAENGEDQLEKTSVFKIKGVAYAFSFLILYSTVEAGIGLWGSSFLVQDRSFSIESAAFWMSFYYGGITLGRFLSGFITMKLNNTQMIRGGLFMAFLGLLLIALPLPQIFSGIAFVLTGFGLAPVFPAMLHETPKRFGRKNSQILIGYQMGFAYLGSALLSPLIGVILQITRAGLLPFIMIFVSTLMFIFSEVLISATSITNRAALYEN
ncbi:MULTISPECIES: sugar MFS transporter [unclassified Oceanispirochaeta]|uniref:MFS transporter n=1 Tax=unclassified Oceanispirochaeta TaxID=2635722 RepID=UPI0018F7C9E1|nr:MULTISPECIES: MFS transporter [unclassified Oceanispirochaeta]